MDEVLCRILNLTTGSSPAYNALLAVSCFSFVFGFPFRSALISESTSAHPSSTAASAVRSTIRRAIVYIAKPTATTVAAICAAGDAKV